MHPLAIVQTTLLFGATGLTGKHVVDAALEAGDNVIAFIRNPSKIPEATRSKITVIQGDLLDREAVTRAVRDSRPDAIIVTTANPRRVAETDLNIRYVPWVIEELRNESRLQEVRLVYLSGFFAFPPDSPPGIMDSIMASIMVPVFGIRALNADNAKVTAYLYDEASRDSNLNFAITRMAMVTEAPSKGRLKIASKSAGSVTFRDMGVFLVKLSHDLGAAKRTAVLVDY